jgi:hypothetical protein
VSSIEAELPKPAGLTSSPISSLAASLGALSAMVYELPPNPDLARRQPCLEFIETRLPIFHEAFANPQVRFNTSLGRYAPISQFTKGNNTMDRPEDHELPVLLPETTPGSARRPFWEEMLPQAMEELKTSRDEPDKLIGTSNSIRAATGWVEMVITLEKARARYYGYSGFIGFWKRTGHKVTDHANDAKRLVSLLPNTEYSSIIHCVFDIIFDASTFVV